MFTKDFVVFDVETTGLDSVKDDIIEIGLVRIKRGEISEKTSWLINPGRPLPKVISELTGITDKMLSGQPSITEVARQIEDYFLGADLVAHNISFDLSFISKYINLDSLKMCYDTLELVKVILPCAVNYTLENVAAELDIQSKNLHRAGDDAELTAQIFIKLYEIASRAKIDALSAITKIFPAESSRQVFFNNALKEKIKYASVGNEKTILRQLNLTPKPLRDEDESYQLNPSEVLSWYEESSPLAQGNPEFEIRPQQLAMAEAVIKAINEGLHSVVEAGTGTGKSLAYLLPAAKFAQHSGKKVAIATNTISLQEQLLLKDIPQLQKVGIDIRATLIKGRTHYICLRKLFSLETLDNATLEEEIALAKIYFWLTETETGDKAELNFPPRANSLWRLLTSDSENCAGQKCKWYAKHCFFWHARRNAELADLLIINHALLLSDCQAEKKVLPDFNYLVIDEAHHLDRAASDHLGSECDFTEISYTMLNLLAAQKNEGYCALGKIRKNLLSLTETERFFAARIIDLIDELHVEQNKVRALIEALKELLYTTNGQRPEESDYVRTLRLKNNYLNQPIWTEIFEQGSSIAQSIAAAALILKNILLEIDCFPNELADKEQWQTEISNYLQYFRKNSEALSVFFKNDLSKEIKWFEFDNEFKNCFKIRFVPYDIGLILKEALYDRCESIVLTSATITVEKKFDYYLENIGLNLVADKVTALTVGSPFDYDNQALVVVPAGMGNPQINEVKFLDATVNFLEEIYRSFHGRTLVLFTSHKQLRYVYEKINLPEDILLLAQNISGSRNKIMQSFCKTENSCLLGANTFWEGIDLPGDLLNLLVIVKLPFLPPTYPLLEAKVERVEEIGHNAFEKVTLPGAIIRFRQGFGRLIRRKDDKGAVVILDGRITAKRYGISFLKSLPIKSFYTASQEDVITKISTWLKKV